MVDSFDDDDGDLSGGTNVDDDTEQLAPEVIDDGLDLDTVDDFDEEDFDEDFDDDFEEEISGEYDLTDDQYGKEFDNAFGHLTRPDEPKPDETADAIEPPPSEPAKPEAKSSGTAAEKPAGSKSATSEDKPARKPARKK